MSEENKSYLKSIKPRNENGLAHGLWECYWSNGELYYKAYFVNDNRIGYMEDYGYTGKLIFKEFILI